MLEVLLQKEQQDRQGQPLAAVLLDAHVLWLDADRIPDVQVARMEAGMEAEAIMESRMQHLRDGEYDAVPQVVDPLTTAARVIRAEALYGKKSPERREAYSSLHIDCRRLLAESWRKGAWEYFSPLQQEYDEDSESYTFMGRSLTEMVGDGITPIAEPEERINRQSEYIEEKTYIAARRLGSLVMGAEVSQKPEAVCVNTISECADWAIEAYDAGERNDLGGYAPEIKKLMIRSVRVESAARYQEQLGVSGEYITHDVVVETMRRRGLVRAGQQPTKVEVRATQMINLNGEGALDVARALDEVASEHAGCSIFLGEKVPDNHPRDYQAVPVEAADRQKQLEEDSVNLAEHLLLLEQGKTDHWAANGLVRAFVTNMLLEKVKNDAAQAEIVFDSKTADSIRRYQDLKTRDIRMAEQVWLEVRSEAPQAGFCGAGSCGLEGEKPTSDAGKKARDLGLKAGSDQELLKDTQRACPDCKKKTIYYDLIGSKACISCNKKDIKSK